MNGTEDDELMARPETIADVNEMRNTGKYLLACSPSVNEMKSNTTDKQSHNSFRGGQVHFVDHALYSISTESTLYTLRCRQTCDKQAVSRLCEWNNHTFRT